MWRRSTSSSDGQHITPHHPPHLPFASSSPSVKQARSLQLHQQQHQAEGPGLRRAKSNHSFNSLGSVGSGSGSRQKWYAEDWADEDDTSPPSAGEPAYDGRRPRAYSLTTHPHAFLARSPSLSGTSGGNTPRISSNGSLSGMLATSARISGGGAGAAGASTRALSFGARRWASLLTPRTDLWREREFEGLQVSPQDDRQYRLVRLPNRLRAIVVSDPRTEKAAASLSVKVGAAQDPRPTPGLAHFCEVGESENHENERTSDACSAAPFVHVD